MKPKFFRLLTVGIALALASAGCNRPASPTPFQVGDTVQVPTSPSVSESATPGVETTPGVEITPGAEASPTPETLAIPIVQVGSPFQIVASPNLIYFDMITSSEGWGLTDEYVLRTRDGANQWENVTPGGSFGAGARLSGYFRDSDTGWVLLSGSDFTSGTLYHTEDGGQTWQQAAVPFGNGSFTFIDPLDGWVMVGTGAGAGSFSVDIYRTGDGGATWQMVYSLDPNGANGLPLSGAKNGIAFSDSTHGWVGGSRPEDGFVWLYASQDGGATWAQQNLALPSGYEDAMTSIEAPIFYSAQVGVLPVTLFKEQTSTVYYVTQNGGVDWTATQVVNNHGHTAVASPQDFWLWDGQSISVSHNGGQVWATQPTNVDLSDTLVQVDFVNASDGFALTRDADGNSLLYFSTDGGLTWTPGQQAQEITPPPTAAPSTPTNPPAPTATPKPTAVSYAGPASRGGPSVVAHLFKNKPVVNGELDEWPWDRYDISTVVFGKSNWKGLDDLSARVSFAWDDKFLYAGGRVKDDTYAQSAQGKNLFKGDSLELLIDTNVPSDFYLKSLSGDDYQIGVSPGSPSPGQNPQVYLWYPQSMAGYLTRAKVGAMAVDNGWRFEVAIPWSDLGIQPQRGMHLGFVFSISDDDNPDKSDQQSMVSNDAARNFLDPTTWGDLTLTGP
jgi:photosystem II stability/assembly factor-like uncharacterized protein